MICHYSTSLLSYIQTTGDCDRLRSALAAAELSNTSTPMPAVLQTDIWALQGTDWTSIVPHLAEPLSGQQGGRSTNHCLHCRTGNQTMQHPCKLFQQHPPHHQRTLKPRLHGTIKSCPEWESGVKSLNRSPFLSSLANSRSDPGFSSHLQRQGAVTKKGCVETAVQQLSETHWNKVRERLRPYQRYAVSPGGSPPDWRRRVSGPKKETRWQHRRWLTDWRRFELCAINNLFWHKFFLSHNLQRVREYYFKESNDR